MYNQATPDEVREKRGRAKAQHLTQIGTGNKPLIELTLTCPAHRIERRFKILLDSPPSNHCPFPTVLIPLSLQFSLPRLLSPDAQFWYVGQTTHLFVIARVNFDSDASGKLIRDLTCFSPCKKIHKPQKKH